LPWKNDRCAARASLALPDELKAPFQLCKAALHKLDLDGMRRSMQTKCDAANKARDEARAFLNSCIPVLTTPDGKIYQMTGIAAQMHPDYSACPYISDARLPGGLRGLVAADTPKPWEFELVHRFPPYHFPFDQGARPEPVFLPNPTHRILPDETLFVPKNAPLKAPFTETLLPRNPKVRPLVTGPDRTVPKGRDIPVAGRNPANDNPAGSGGGGIGTAKNNAMDISGRTNTEGSLSGVAGNAGGPGLGGPGLGGAVTPRPGGGYGSGMMKDASKAKGPSGGSGGSQGGGGSGGYNTSREGGNASGGAGGSQGGGGSGGYYTSRDAPVTGKGGTNGVYQRAPSSSIRSGISNLPKAPSPPASNSDPPVDYGGCARCGGDQFRAPR
jgi:hypothetical protein